MLMRPKHWLARLLALNSSGVHDLMGAHIAHPVGSAVARRHSRDFPLGV